MRSLKIGALAALTLSSAVSSAQPQEPRNPEKPRPVRRWALTFGGGRASGGATEAIEKGMSAGGLNQSLTNFLSGGAIQFPASHGGNPALAFRLSYLLRPRLQLGLFTSGLVGLGTTSGHQGSAQCCRWDIPTTFLDVSASVRTTAALASFAGEGVRIGAGPSWNSVRGEQRSPGGGGVSQSSTRIGFVVDAGITAPARSRFFVDLGLQYRYVGTVPVGPFQGVGTGSATMPATRVSFNNRSFILALGLRF